MKKVFYLMALLGAGLILTQSCDSGKKPTKQNEQEATCLFKLRLAALIGGEEIEDERFDRIKESHRDRSTKTLHGVVNEVWKEYRNDKWHGEDPPTLKEYDKWFGSYLDVDAKAEHLKTMYDDELDMSQYDQGSYRLMKAIYDALPPAEKLKLSDFKHVPEASEGKDYVFWYIAKSKDYPDYGMSIKKVKELDGTWSATYQVRYLGDEE